MTSLADPAMRIKELALLGGKMIGLILVLTAMRIFLAPTVFARAALASTENTRQLMAGGRYFG
jgi:hypothetical protein